jgi:hypothetical protein
LNLKISSAREFHSESSNKNKTKGALNDFDIILFDQRINIQKAAKELGVGMQILCRKKKFPFPIKIHGENYTGKKIAGNIHAAVKDCTHALIGGGSDF